MTISAILVAGHAYLQIAEVGQNVLSNKIKFGW